MDSVIHLSEMLYQIVVKEAAARQRSPDQFAEEVLASQLLPQHPHVEVISSRSGPRPVVRGTRVGVDVVVGYLRAGHTPEQLASELLPQLSLAQIYDALSYFYDHPDAVEAALADRAAGAWETRLKQRLGEADYARLTGASIHA